MKTIFTICFWLCGTAAVFGQQQSAALIHEEALLTNPDSTLVFYTYTSANLVASVTTQHLEGGNWKNKTQTLYTYNILDLLTESIEFDWNVGEQAWLNSRRNTRTYTAGGELLTNLNQDWGSNDWVNDTREIYYFSTAELPDSSIGMMWNGADEWQFTNKAFYDWNAAGLLEDAIYSVFIDNAWRPNSRLTNTYTAFDALDVSTRYVYYNPQTWVPYARETNVYNADEQLTELQIETYYAETENWVYNFRVSYTYNGDGTLHQEIYANFDEALSFFVPVARNTYFYGDYALGLGEEAFATVDIFPNPTQADVQIRFEQATTAELILTDLQGKTLSATAVSGLTATISLEVLPAGTYLLNIRSGNQNGVRRIVKL